MNAFKYPRWLPIVWAGLFFGLAGYVLLSSDSPKAHSSSEVIEASLTQTKGLPSPTVFRGSGVGGEGQQETTYITKPIRDVQVGDWVLAENPELTGVEFEEQTVDETSWRSIDFEMSKPNGGLLRMTFLRPVAWIEELGIREGEPILLDIEEITAKGSALVTSVGHCPKIKPRPSVRHQMVTGIYEHSADTILNVHVEGLDEAIGTTPEHLFWSEDRQAFVAAKELDAGERLRTADAKLHRVIRSSLASPATVFNLEVNNQHVFYITDRALLVHNNQYEKPVFRGGSGTPNNLTPRSKDIDGLSARIIPPGGKSQVIDPTKLKKLEVVRDASNHASIRPRDMSRMQEWIDSINSEELHEFTQELMQAVVAVERR